MKIRWKITLAMDVLLLIIFASSLLLVRGEIVKIVNDSAETELSNYSSIGLTLLDFTYPGDWSIKDGTLYKGNTLINNDFKVVDRLSANTGILATVFAGDTRISTSIKDESGNRITGTQASKEVQNIVLKEGKDYQGTAVVNGKNADAYYVPLKSSDGTVIGMWFVGIYTAKIDNKINNALFSTSGFLIAFLLLGSIAAYFLGHYIAKAYSVIRKNLERLEQGDFNVEFHVKSHARKDEVGDIIRSFQNMQAKVTEIIKSIKVSTGQISDSSLILADGADNVYRDVENISATTEELSAGMEETAASTEEMNATSVSIEEEINHVAQKAADGQERASEIKERAKNLKSVALESQKTAVEIYDNTNKKLRQSIEKAAAINEIKALSKTILEITAQTNLLALNASIESARAGEAGKGFAVVASEIANLASNSKKAVSQIETISNDISITVEEIVANSKLLLDFVDSKVIGDYGFLVETGEQYDDDANTVEQMVTEIKTSTTQLSESISYIRKAIEEVTTASQEGAKGSSEIAEKSTSIFHKTNEFLEQANKNREIAANLDELVQFFKID
jgi:methyl-accepting chemotaxis protein